MREKRGESKVKRGSGVRSKGPKNGQRSHWECAPDQVRSAIIRGLLVIAVIAVVACNACNARIARIAAGSGWVRRRNDVDDSHWSGGRKSVGVGP